MASPSLTYTLSNGSTADATQVQQNFTDIINGITDTTKDLSISALTCAGTATFNGAVTLGNSTADDLIFTGYAASNVIPKTNATYDLGSSSLTWNNAYITSFGTNPAGKIAAASYTATFTAVAGFSGLDASGSITYMRIGNIVHIVGYATYSGLATGTNRMSVTFPSGLGPATNGRVQGPATLTDDSVLDQQNGNTSTNNTSTFYVAFYKVPAGSGTGAVQFVAQYDLTA